MSKNIYGTKLQKCNNTFKNIQDSSINGYCNEPGGGYHNVCIKMNPFISNNFSEITGQNNWSKSKEGRNHCICQGAWANYISRLKQLNEYNELPLGILNCEAIPKEILTEYKKEFKKWNNRTIHNQHIDAYNEILRQCPKIKKNYDVYLNR